MTFSKLIKGTIPHHGKYHSREGRGVAYMIDHHWAGTAGGDVSLADPNRDASVHYIIYSNGDIYGQVPEEFRAWTSGDWDADSRAITVEMQNSTGAPEWKVSDKALASLVRLTADIAKRHGWKTVPSWRVRGHREFAATACPGPYLWPRLPEVAKAANEILHPKPVKQEIKETDMRTIYNINNKNEDTRRALVGELTFKVERAAVSTRSRKLWEDPVNVTQGEWDAEIAAVNQRRKMVGLEPIKGTYNEFYDPAAGDKK